MSKIDRRKAEDLAWSEANRAVLRTPHREISMLSLNSTGAIKSWYCPICASKGWTSATYTVTSRPPTCQGGL